MSTLLTIKEAAERCKVCPNTISKLIKEAELIPVKFPDSRKTYISENDLEDFINRKRTHRETPHKEEILGCAVRVPKSGVYFLIDKDEIVYIGMSSNLFARIGRHIFDGDRVFTKYTIIEMPQSDIKRFESELIERYKPKYNISENH